MARGSALRAELQRFFGARLRGWRGATRRGLSSDGQGNNNMINFSQSGVEDKSSRYGPHADMVTAGMMVRMSQGARGRAPTAISEGARLSQAVKIMADRNLGAILCTKEGDEGEGARLAGMVTERDYLRKVVLRGRTSEDTTCGDVMATRLDAARPSHTLDMCLRLFLTKYTRHIPVVSRHADVGRPSLRDVHGVVSMGDAGWILWTVLSKSREEAAGHRYWITDITVGHVLEVAQKEEKAFEIAPGKTVYEALEEMERHKIGGLLVRNPDERACGLITEHDYLTQVHVKGRSSKNTKVEDIMTAQPICVTPSDTIDDVLYQMVVNRCRHLPVVARGSDIGWTIGKLISFGDVIATVVRHADSPSSSP